MKKDIHPTYYPDARVICACGRSWTTGSTKKEIRTDTCSECHPFFTGEQRLVDTAGQVERFERRLGQRREFESKMVARQRKRGERRAREVVIEVAGEPKAAAPAAPAEQEAEASQLAGAAPESTERPQAEGTASAEGEAADSATEGK